MSSSLPLFSDHWGTCSPEKVRGPCGLCDIPQAMRLLTILHFGRQCCKRNNCYANHLFPTEPYSNRREVLLTAGGALSIKSLTALNHSHNLNNHYHVLRAQNHYLIHHHKGDDSTWPVDPTGADL